MAATRYLWWGYIKSVVRKHRERNRELLNRCERKEYDAVEAANKEITRKRNGTDILRLVDMVFWKKTHTLEGSAMALYISYETAKNWHSMYIKTVAKNLGIYEGESKRKKCSRKKQSLQGSWEQTSFFS